MIKFVTNTLTCYLAMQTNNVTSHAIHMTLAMSLATLIAMSSYLVIAMWTTYDIFFMIVIELFMMFLN
jgi:hypothetical protein